MRIAY